MSRQASVNQRLRAIEENLKFINNQNHALVMAVMGAAEKLGVTPEDLLTIAKEKQEKAAQQASEEKDRALTNTLKERIEVGKMEEAVTEVTSLDEAINT
jgi:apolipoprotein N-acyltransferase